MDWTTKLQLLSLWHAQSDIRQRAMMKDIFSSKILVDTMRPVHSKSGNKQEQS